MSDRYHDLKQAIRHAVHTCVITYWERQRKPLIHRDDGLAQAIADCVALEVIEKEKLPREFDVEQALIREFIIHLPDDGKYSKDIRNLLIAVFREAAPKLASAAVGAKPTTP